MQSAFRSTLSSWRRLSRTLPVAATVLALASAGFGQTLAAQASPAATVATLTTETSAARNVAAGATTFTIHLTPVPQAADSRGTVDFVDTDSDGHERSIGSALVAEDGTATLTVSSLPAGAHSVRGVYSDATGSAASTSSPAEITAEATLPDFTLSATPTTLNVDAGTQAAIAVTLSPANGFSNYVSLSCAGLPLYTTCSFLPSNVPVTGKTGQSTMTLNTVAPSGNKASLGSNTGLVYAFLLPGALGLLGLGFSRNRGVRTLAMIAVVCGLVGGASSCAQRYRYLNHGPPDNPGTPNGMSVIRIFGTSVSGAQSNIKCFQITLNVTSTNTSGTSGNITTPCS